jgi:hypothetical protein
MGSSYRWGNPFETYQAWRAEQEARALQAIEVALANLQNADLSGDEEPLNLQFPTDPSIPGQPPISHGVTQDFTTIPTLDHLSDDVGRELGQAIYRFLGSAGRVLGLSSDTPVIQRQRDRLPRLAGIAGPVGQSRWSAQRVMGQRGWHHIQAETGVGVRHRRLTASVTAVDGISIYMGIPTITSIFGLIRTFLPTTLIAPTAVSSGLLGGLAVAVWTYLAYAKRQRDYEKAMAMAKKKDRKEWATMYGIKEKELSEELLTAMIDAYIHSKHIIHDVYVNEWLDPTTEGLGEQVGAPRNEDYDNPGLFPDDIENRSSEEFVDRLTENVMIDLFEQTYVISPLMSAGLSFMTGEALTQQERAAVEERLGPVFRYHRD